MSGYQASGRRSQKGRQFDWTSMLLAREDTARQKSQNVKTEGKQRFFKEILSVQEHRKTVEQAQRTRRMRAVALGLGSNAQTVPFPFSSHFW